MNYQNLFTKYNIDKFENIVIGVSSGPDSMALLHMIKTFLPNKIIVAHINHNIRTESKEEEIFLKNYCNINNIIFESITLTQYTENNFENEARKKRYKFYEKILKKYNSKYLFLAHHGDDLIETILMKISRGSNIEGYAGIKEIKKLQNYTIIRPLLQLTKEQLILYNKENNIKYYNDKSNQDIKYTRNRYRKQILPILKKEDKNIHIKYLKFSNTLNEYQKYIESLVDKKIKKIIIKNKINITLLLKEDDFLIKQIIFTYLKNIYNNEPNIIKDKNLCDILKIIHSKKPNIQVSLPNNFIAIKEYQNLYIKKPQQENEEYKIELKQNITITKNNISIKLNNNIKTNDNSVCRLNSHKIKLPLYIRNKKDGDFIELLNIEKKKKIKDIFIENKIPKSLRKSYPILVDSEDNIIWIPNLKKSKYNVKKNEICDIIITSHKEREEINEHKNNKIKEK